ncbi:MAG TPA: zinc ribbon domain-containing protein [Chthonomonadaceae bacterium]|nr:zinc ribbon domain-containing protein [Chthonomonadaceae bacterium]
MTMPHKVCPRCQTPAPLEARFCSQCGRQYRTQFPASSPSSPAAAPETSFTAAPRAQTPLLKEILLGGTALLVFCVVLFSAIHARQANEPHTLLPPPMPPAGPVGLSGPAEAPAVDPLTSEAQHAVERANQRLGLPPPGSVDAQGRIHLRTGGTISKEEWDAARRKVEQSPLLGGSSASIPHL